MLRRRRAVPRPLTREELTEVLSKEHDELRDQVSKLRNALTEEDYTRVAEVVDRLQQPLSELASNKAEFEFNNLHKPHGEYGDTKEKLVSPYVVRTHRETPKKQ